MRDHKDHRRRLGAKNDVSTLSSAINSCTYTAPDLWKMVHGFGNGGRKDVRMLNVKGNKIQGFHIRKHKAPKAVSDQIKTLNEIRHGNKMLSKKNIKHYKIITL